MGGCECKEIRKYAISLFTTSLLAHYHCTGLAGIGKSALSEGVRARLQECGHLLAGFLRVDLFGAHTQEGVYATLFAGLGIIKEVRCVMQFSFPNKAWIYHKQARTNTCVCCLTLYLQDGDESTTLAATVARRLTTIIGQRMPGRKGWMTSLLLILDTCEIPLADEGAAGALAAVLKQVSAGLQMMDELCFSCAASVVSRI